ncbi:MAG: DHHA1 domain-containing protein, partial [Pseudomonadota bacterium]
PLVGLNRILVKRGMELINLAPRMGLTALKEISGLKNRINSDAISYILSPRLNAAGRMGNASRSVELLMSKDQAEACELAAILHEENQKRVSVQNKSWTQVQEMIEGMILSKSSAYFENKFSLTLASEGWHQGVIGIIASKAAERWYKPTAVYSISENGKAKGSARSVPGVDIYNIFSGFKEIFEDFGGHGMASGMSIRTERIPKFEELFEQGVSKYINAQKIQPVLDIDVEVGMGEVGMKAVTEISTMEPFGIGNPAPLFLCSDVKVFSKTVLKEKHLKLKLEKNIDAIGFNMGELHDLIGDTINIVFRPSINEWNGMRQLQYVIVDID